MKNIENKVLKEFIQDGFRKSYKNICMSTSKDILINWGEFSKFSIDMVQYRIAKPDDIGMSIYGLTFPVNLKKWKPNDKVPNIILEIRRRSLNIDEAPLCGDQTSV